MRSEKLQTIKDYFEQLGVEMPIDVSNSLEDVFDENDDVTSVDVYMRGDVDDFAYDTTIKNNVVINPNGPSTGSYTSSFTYYGDVSLGVGERFSVDLDGEDYVLHDLSNDIYPTLIADENCWAVILLETITLGEGSFTKELALKIYCPEEEE